MAPTRQHPQPPRKSLVQSLKDLLLCRRRSAGPQQKTVGSGILRKADPSVAYLPLPSQVSFFPDFQASRFDLDKFGISPPHQLPPSNGYQRPTTDDVQRRPRHDIGGPLVASQVSLLPATRLSQLDLFQSFVTDRRQRPEYNSTSDGLPSGSRHRGSLASSATCQQPPRSSTLRLQKSALSLSDSLRSDLTPKRTSTSTSMARSTTTSSLSRPPQGGHPTPTGTRTQERVPAVGIPWASRDSLNTNDDDTSVEGVEFFRSFCVLDTSAPGCPVIATSDDLKFIFDFGEQFFLNNHECEGSSMDVVFGYDAAGNERAHLVMFSPLVIPSSGRSRFLLASLVDVTTFVHQAASNSHLNTITEESIVPESKHERERRFSERAEESWSNKNYELSSEDLLGGCCINETSARQPKEKQSSSRVHLRGEPMDTTPLSRSLDDVWIDIAKEEQEKAKSDNGSSAGSRTPTTFRSSASSCTSNSSVDDVLAIFMKEIQKLHSSFFLLAKSPLDDSVFEICNVSPLVFAGGEYVKGHLRHTPREAIDRLSQHLAGEAEFDVWVRWGVQGEEKHLYCIPIFGQRSLTWVCFLVDKGLRPLW